MVGEAELIEFRSEVETLAARSAASVAAPEMRETLDRARALDRHLPVRLHARGRHEPMSVRPLDQSCADADIQVAFNVVGADGGSIAIDAARQALRANGLATQGPLRWSRADGQGRELFCVTAETGQGEVLTRLTLSLDVPRTPELRRSYESMVLLARDLAATLNGSVQDDNGRVLDEHALSAIAAQLEPVRADLEKRGFPPGGALALRLFS